jgi:signal peptidase I
LIGRPLWATAVAGLALAAAVGAVHMLRRRYLVVTVAGPSMTPTFRDGDRVLVRRADGGRCRTGDVVVLQAPQGPGWQHPPPAPMSLRGPWHLKRVAAVAGEPVPEAVAQACGQPAGSAVPANRVIVIGDARASYDSRAWGFLPVDRVLGVVLRRLPKPAAAEKEASR